MLRRKERDDDIGPSKGFMKYFHKFMMLLLFPLRKPIWFVLIVIVLFLAPTFRGVKPTEVHTWYWSKIKNSSSTVSTLVTDKTREYMPKMEMPDFVSSATKEEPTVPAAKVVDMPVKEMRRKTFERAKSAPVAIDLMAQRRPVAEAPATETQPTPLPVQNTAATAPAPKKLALVYVNEPKKITGTAQILNGNELRIGNDDIILFGIYVNPKTEQGRQAATFLSQTVNNQTVSCVVEAYTYQGVATGICSVNGLNINKTMVEKGLSRNVALE